MSVNKSEIKHIFYFNINYACNNQCIFCYSHNTRVAKKHEECELSSIEEYLVRQNISSKDRIIINGGEPLLYSQLYELLFFIAKYGCEVLIYTNGRLLSNFASLRLPKSYRFIVPIHGCKEVHNSITQCNNSFDETLLSLERMRTESDCQVDIKIIINPAMISSPRLFSDSLTTYSNLQINGSFHITKMADTKVSNHNGCKSISNEVAAQYTRELFSFLNNSNRTIKLFDTCIKKLDMFEINNCEDFNQNIEVFFKDCHLEKRISTDHIWSGECTDCIYKKRCYSAVDQYKVLEWRNSHWYENLE